MATGEHTINFSALEGDSSGDLNMFLDDDQNLLIYGEDKTSFEAKEIAYIGIIGNFEVTNLSTTVGQLAVTNNNVSYAQEETLTFVNSKEASLSLSPSGIVTYKWIGKNGGNPIFAGTTVTLQEKVSGLLEVSYNSQGQRIALSNADLDETEYDVLVTVVNEAEQASLTVPFESEEAAEDLVSLKILVKDICTGNAIPNAHVSITGLGSGTTDSDGYFLLAEPGAQPGKSYSIRVTATGYMPTNEDNVSNDTFVVPEPTSSSSTVGDSSSSVDCPYLESALAADSSGIYYLSGINV